MARFKLVVCTLLLRLCLAETPATIPNKCVGSLSIGSFRLLVERDKHPPRALRLVNNLKAGETLRYEPVKIPEASKSKGQVAVILVGPAQELAVLEPRAAAKAAEWKIPADTAVVGVVFGPHGLSVKKVKSLVGRDDEVLSQLADYAEQTEKIEALVNAVAKSEASGASVDAALAGFSTQYNVALPKIDRTAPSDQQASLLLRAMMPSVAAYDPLTPQSTVQQSTGLAAALASVFFGTPAGLAASGASLFQNLRLAMFPEAEFRSAIARNSESDLMALCAKPQPPKPHTRVAFLWAHRVPTLAAPAAVIADSPHLPIGIKSAVHGKNLSHLDRAHDWRLVGASGKIAYPAAVTASADTLTLDLTQTKAPAGEYRLAAEWDWDPFEIGGTVHLDAMESLAGARVTASAGDRLVEANGKVPVELDGPNFEFVEKAAIEKDGKRPGAPVAVEFTLPKGKRAGEQRSLEVDLDTNALRRGAYKLLLTQADQKTYSVPVTVHPPNPKLENLPMRVNLGETRQTLPLRGSGLERVEQITSRAGEIRLAGGVATIELGRDVKAGEEFAIEMKVQGIDAPIEAPNAIVVAGPRPKIAGVRKSFGGEAGASLRAGEIPSGAPVSFELTVEHLDAAPTVELSCGAKTAPVAARIAGAGVLFFAIDPGSVGQSGCALSATVTEAATGASDPLALGRIVRLPRIARFQLTDEKLGDAIYAGRIEGEDLETIAKTGWDDSTGLAVEGLPTPLAADTRTQALKIALPWPAPSPHAPLYIWLRGEKQGRPTGVKY